MPFQGRFNSTRRDGHRSPVRRFSRSPVRRFSHSPVRRNSRSPIRRGSRTPIRRMSPIRRFSRSPVRRFSRSPIRQNQNNFNRNRNRNNLRSRTRSPTRKKTGQNENKIFSNDKHETIHRKRDHGVERTERVADRSERKNKFQDYGSNQHVDRIETRLPSTHIDNSHRKRHRSRSLSPLRKLSPEYTASRRLSDRLGPISSPTKSPKIIRDTSGLSRFETLITRKKSLDNRFRTVNDGHFKIDENITIGIQRNPYAPASTTVTVERVFDPRLFSMVHSRDTGRRPVFDRPELKYFHFDEMSHDDEQKEYEKRTIKVAPSATVTSGSSSGHSHHVHMSRRSPSPSRSTEVKLEMHPDPKYEPLYQESLHEGYRGDIHSKVITNPNDLRHNLSKRQEEDARFKLDAKRQESGRSRGDIGQSRATLRSRSRSPGRGRFRDRDNRQVQSRKRSPDVTDSSKELPDFSRRPDKNKYEPWQDNPSMIPKGISYFQSSGKAKIIRSIKGYISDVSEKFRSFKKRGIEQFWFNFYTESEFIKGISFNPQTWNSLKTVDGSTCLGVMLSRAKLRPPKQLNGWNLVIDRFTIIEPMLMPFDLQLETKNLSIGNAHSNKMMEKYDYDSTEDIFSDENMDEQTFFKGDQYFFKGDQSFFKEDISVSKGEKYFSKGEKFFSKEEQFFSKGEKPFSKGEKPFSKGEKSFSKGEKSFSKREKPFVKEDKSSKGKKSFKSKK